MEALQTPPVHRGTQLHVGARRPLPARRRHRRTRQERAPEKASCLHSRPGARGPGGKAARDRRAPEAGQELAPTPQRQPTPYAGRDRVPRRRQPSGPGTGGKRGPARDEGHARPATHRSHRRRREGMNALASVYMTLRLEAYGSAGRIGCAYSL